MVQAGHPHPLVLRSNGDTEMIGSGGLPVGLIPQAEYEEETFFLAPGDRLLIYSDGLTECPGTDGKMLEEDGLKRLCRRHRTLGPTGFLSALSDEPAIFAGGSDLPDDVSALVLDYTAQPLD